MPWGSAHVAFGLDDDRLIDEALEHYAAWLDGQIKIAKDHRREGLCAKKARAERLLLDRRYPI